MKAAGEAPAVDLEGLNGRQIEFIKEYTSGEWAGNATRAYKKVYNADQTDESAAASASFILTNPKVRAAIKALHEAAMTRVVEELTPWMQLAPEAQCWVLRIMRGEVPMQTATRLAAAIHLLDRAFGKSTERTEIIERERIGRATQAYVSRLGRDGVTG